MSVWRTPDGWTVTSMVLEGVSRRDYLHDIWLRPTHDGQWLAVDEPNGFLAGYVDSVTKLYQHWPHLRGRLEEVT